MLFIIQIVAVVAGLLAFAWFAQNNLAIMKFRKFSGVGLLHLWTGNINTQQLITGNKLNPGKIEKELVKAVVIYKRSRIIFYACLLVNLVVFLLHSLTAASSF